jgi:hypothetical protein
VVATRFGTFLRVPKRVDTAGVATRFGTFFGTSNFGVFGTNFSVSAPRWSVSAPPSDITLSIGITMEFFLTNFIRFGTIFVCFTYFLSGTTPQIS